MSPMPSQPVILPKKKRPRRRGRLLSPVRRSARLYVYIDPSRVHLFRYFLEAEDNLGLMTVVDRWRAALLIRYSPHQDRAVRDFLGTLRDVLDFEGPFELSRGRAQAGAEEE